VYILMLNNKVFEPPSPTVSSILRFPAIFESIYFSGIAPLDDLNLFTVNCGFLTRNRLPIRFTCGFWARCFCCCRASCPSHSATKYEYPWIIKNVWLVVFDLEAIGLIDSRKMQMMMMRYFLKTASICLP